MSISHFVLSSSFNNAAPFHLFIFTFPGKIAVPCSYSPPGRMQGGAGSPHSSRLEESSANYLTIIIMTMTTGALGTSTWCRQGQRQKSRCFSREWCRNCSPHGHQEVLVQRPASLDLLISLVNLVIRHSAPTLVQPWFLFWS